MNDMIHETALPRIDIKKGHDRRVLKGHPWIFSNELAASPADRVPGELVRVHDSKGRFLGTGYVNPHSLIAVRMLRRSEGAIDEQYLAGRIDTALALRDRIYPGEDAVRLIYSESDGLPGLVVDRYGDHLAVQVTTAGMELLLPGILDHLEMRTGARCIVARNDIGIRKLEGLEECVEILRGEVDPALEVSYEGLQLNVDLLGGQKTGLFLDQRDNQRTLLSWCSRGEVLDCYCYQGIWALQALRYGASQVTGIDSSADALTRAAAHADANDLADRAEWVRDEVLEALKGFRAEGRTFDFVIVDPPAFVRSRKHLKAGLRGYLDLNRKALETVSPGGILVTCSCSQHVQPEAFLETVSHAAGLAGRHVRVLTALGQSRDHPPLLAAPETSYLKCLALHVE
ncbi:class I SAM-dependent rRNA methyltransferase [Candidatus Zixiibacteriota bacterium]